MVKLRENLRCLRDRESDSEVKTEAERLGGLRGRREDLEEIVGRESELRKRERDG
jgi:hypothetical protein